MSTSTCQLTQMKYHFMAFTTLSLDFTPVRTLTIFQRYLLVCATHLKQVFWKTLTRSEDHYSFTHTTLNSGTQETKCKCTPQTELSAELEIKSRKTTPFESLSTSDKLPSSRGFGKRAEKTLINSLRDESTSSPLSSIHPSFSATTPQLLPPISRVRICV